MKILGIIPARYDSSRFPGKPLVEIGNQSMIQRVYDQAKKSTLLHDVIVATDDKRIIEHLQLSDRQVEWTSASHQSGTDRIAEVAARHPHYDIVINIQGDEPFIQPSQIDTVIQPFLKYPKMEITTLMKRITDKTALLNPNIVKVVFDSYYQALYFSRQPLPFLRDIPLEKWLEHHTYFQHIGLYGFRNTILQAITRLPQSKLEKAESLEQLRWLEHQYVIQLSITEESNFGIDTPEDLEKAKRLFNL
jgi:3-deoxy-manno-octulosonate cytidylyltransferase (CMP-KDO synthetase)